MDGILAGMAVISVVLLGSNVFDYSVIGAMGAAPFFESFERQLLLYGHWAAAVGVVAIAVRWRVPGAQVAAATRALLTGAYAVVYSTAPVAAFDAYSEAVRSPDVLPVAGLMVAIFVLLVGRATASMTDKIFEQPWGACVGEKPMRAVSAGAAAFRAKHQNNNS